MADTAITYTPRDAPEKIALIGTAPAVSLFSGHRELVGHTSFSHGGKAVSVSHDSYFVIDGELASIGPGVDAKVWMHVSAWLSEAKAGVEFAFALDDTEDTDTTLSGAESHGSTVIGLADTTGMSVGDWLFFEDLDDPTQCQDGKILTVDSGIQITLETNTALRANYVSGSICRHRDFYPACVLLSSSLRERRAGQGAGLWDLRFRFRTVR